jgi:hypothetical protein
MSAGSGRIIAVVGALLGVFGACRDFGDYVSSEGGGSGAGATGGEPTGGGGMTTGGTAGAESGGAGGNATGGASGDAQGGSGMGGDGGLAGDSGGAPADCRYDQTVVPECISLPPTTHVGIDVGSALSAAVAGVNYAEGRFHLFASRNGSNTLGTAFTRFPDHATWYDWSCFDAVPNPVRLAATTLSNDAPEVFVTTDCGGVYVRRYFPEVHLMGWSPWVPLRLPSDVSFVTDVVISRSRGPNRGNHLFVLDRGTVFAAKKDDDPYGPYGDWNRVASGAGSRIAAGMLYPENPETPDEGGRHLLFTIDARGRPFVSTQTTGDDLDSFEPWADFDADRTLEFELVDIDAPYNIDGALLVVGVDTEGAVWTREQVDFEFGDWQKLTDVEPPPKLVTIAGASISGRTDDPLLLVGVAEGGEVYFARQAKLTSSSPAVWEPWRRIPVP